MQNARLKLPPGELAKCRRVWVVTRTLNQTQKEGFEETSVEVVFSTTFLEHAREELKRTSAQLRNSGERARNALTLIGAQTIKQVLSQPYGKLALAPGMGPCALALLLDVLCLFGLEIQGVPPKASRKPVDVETKADELAAALGLGTD